MSDLMTALVHLAQAHGHDIVAKVDKLNARRDRGGTWTLRDHDDRELCEINVEAGLCLVHQWTQRGTGPRVAEVVSTRVRCDCGHMEQMPGRATSGTRYACGNCKRTVFVQG
jgi:hypothetical protein